MTTKEKLLKKLGELKGQAESNTRQSKIDNICDIVDGMSNETVEKVKILQSILNWDSENASLLDNLDNQLDKVLENIREIEDKSKKENKKNKIISISIGAIIGVGLLIFGLCCSFFIPNLKDKDTLYFVIESVKDIISSIAEGVGGGIAVYSYKNISQNNNVTKNGGIALMIIGGLGALMIFIFAIFSAFGGAVEWGYIIFEIVFIILTVCGVICIFKNPKQIEQNQTEE